MVSWTKNVLSKRSRQRSLKLFFLANFIVKIKLHITIFRLRMFLILHIMVFRYSDNPVIAGPSERVVICRFELNLFIHAQQWRICDFYKYLRLNYLWNCVYFCRLCWRLFVQEDSFSTESLRYVNDFTGFHSVFRKCYIVSLCHSIKFSFKI